MATSDYQWCLYSRMQTRERVWELEFKSLCEPEPQLFRILRNSLDVWFVFKDKIQLFIYCCRCPSLLKFSSETTVIQDGRKMDKKEKQRGTVFNKRKYVRTTSLEYLLARVIIGPMFKPSKYTNKKYRYFHEQMDKVEEYYQLDNHRRQRKSL